MNLARAELWRTAEALSRAMGPALSPRARQLLAREDPPIGIEDLQRAPEWAGDSPQARARLTRLTGAAAVANAWRRTIDGMSLRRASEAIGERALDSLLTLSGTMTPAIADRAAEAGEAAALDRLGARALLADAADASALRPRLYRLLGISPGAAPDIDRGVAAAARRAAEGMLAQLHAGERGRS